MVELIYVSDGLYDAGHYDLVLKLDQDDERLQRVEKSYGKWRRSNVQEILEAVRREDSDNNTYGE